MLLKLMVLTAFTQACVDFDAGGCQIRSETRGFCSGAWGKTNCCETCKGFVEPAVATCRVPRARCTEWSCPMNSRQPVGTKCVLKQRLRRGCCKDLVSHLTGAPYNTNERVCESDGAWSGPLPVCRRHLHHFNSDFQPTDSLVERSPKYPNSFDQPQTAKTKTLKDPSTDQKLLPISTNPALDKAYGRWMKGTINVPPSLVNSTPGGQSPGLFIVETLEKDCPKAVPHAMDVWAQWLDWEMTGKVGHPEVANWLSADKKGLIWTMFGK